MITVKTIKSLTDHLNDLKDSVVYLSTPFSHSDEKIKQDRVKETLKFAAYLLNHHSYVISPIIAGLPIAQAHDLPDTFEFWTNYCKALLKKCDVVIVLMIDGWEGSTGVQAEILLAKKYHKTVYYMEYNNEVEEYIVKNIVVNLSS